MKLLQSLYALALYAYPREFRARFGPEMQQVFRTRCGRAARISPFLLATARELIVTSAQERFATMNMRRIARGFAYFAGGAVLFLAVSATMVQAYFIPTESMGGTLRAGDHLLVNKLHRDPQRGEIVVFRFPEDTSQVFIKRVIGLPGDRIRVENKQVIRNGQRLTENYVQHRQNNFDNYRDNFPGVPQIQIEPRGAEMLAQHVSNGEVTVPPGTLFVLGDNRDISLDSRYFGFVPQTEVIGRPWLVYWSVDGATHKTRWDRTLQQVR